MFYYRLPLYVFFGILPSVTWLFYYLRKDLHPEPKRMILKIFLYGGLITVPVFLMQVGLSELLKKTQSATFFTSYPIAIDILKWFIIIAFTEELLKYLVVKLNVLRSYALDEPLDIMLYMVVSALGFAAVENTLYLFSPIDNLSFNAIIQTTVIISFIRFVGATFLHTLSSALVGYFLALSSVRKGKEVTFTAKGIFFATLLHGLYNFSIMTLRAPLSFAIPIMVIMGLVIFIMYDFNEIKKIKSICKL